MQRRGVAVVDVLYSLMNLYTENFNRTDLHYIHESHLLLLAHEESNTFFFHQSDVGRHTHNFPLYHLAVADPARRLKSTCPSDLFTKKPWSYIKTGQRMLPKFCRNFSCLNAWPDDSYVNTFVKWTPRSPDAFSLRVNLAWEFWEELPSMHGLLSKPLPSIHAYLCYGGNNGEAA